MKAPPSLLWMALAVGLGGAAHLAQGRADQIRSAERDGQVSWAEPNPDAVRVASMGFQVAVADLLWVRGILLFAQMMETRDPKQVHWLGAMLDTVSTLDPKWRTAYFYGGAMLRALGDIDGSDRVFERACRELPDDPYFPFSVGMNAYLYRGDTTVGAEWLSRAAAIPGAPSWYGAAAAGFLSRSGQREAGVHYLRERLDETSDPAIRASLQSKLDTLVHDELSDRLGARLSALREQAGGAAVGLSALEPLPPDPHGEGWVLAPDGVIRSPSRERYEARSAITAERATLTRAWPATWSPPTDG
jgi:tetratricopeptide (TPR) repeat protein